MTLWRRACMIGLATLLLATACVASASEGGQSGGEEDGMPTQDPWEAIPARLNQRMATRTGPGTQYTEDHGTLPKDTAIVVYQQAEGSGVPWGLVEFEVRGKLVRAYTGMKRIDADSTPPQAPKKPQIARLAEATQAYFGPGTQYMPVPDLLPAQLTVEVWGEEQGYALVDYFINAAQRMRAWVPVSGLVDYVSSKHGQ